jgi:hypothetical protein
MTIQVNRASSWSLLESILFNTEVTPKERNPIFSAASAMFFRVEPSRVV